ncbi:hypothetical protein Leryth_019478 [Lithospermum erythrorhizon]|nr:hypothetical protein Leryth_019478 [Lithospermum erythrorhizon]
MKTLSPFSDKWYFCRKERWWNQHNRRSSVAPFLLCSIILTSLFCLLTLYSTYYSCMGTIIPLDDKHVLDQNSTLLQHNNANVGKDQRCDLFEGQWIPDLNATSYTNYSCQTIPESKNCFKNGREDVDFLNWRWKPQDCDLPKFDPKRFMEIVKGKKLAFIGDSVARNQVESLLCLLSKEGIPVVEFKDVDDGLGRIFNLHLDKIKIEWANKITDMDFAIISDGHWFFRKLYLYHNGVVTGCVYCNEPNITEKGLSYAIGESFRTAFRYINSCKECKKGVTTLLRTFSPPHFEHGTWNDGGSCNRTSPHHQLDEKSMEYILELRNVQFQEVERARMESFVKKKEDKRFEILDVTKAMLMRPDGHPGAFWGNKWMKGYNDCVHWCLPGPVDFWNQLLMAILQRNY